MKKVKLVATTLILVFASCNKKVEKSPTIVETVKTTKASIESKVITASDLPKNLIYEGVYKEGISMKDSAGEHFVFLTETDKVPSKKIIDPEEDDKDKKLFAYNYLLDTIDNKFKLNWKIQDFEANCGFDLMLARAENKFKR